MAQTATVAGNRTDPTPEQFHDLLHAQVGTPIQNVSYRRAGKRRIVNK